MDPMSADDTMTENEGSGIAAALVGFFIVALLAVGAIVGGIILLGGDDGGGGTPTEYVVDVPEGTYQRIQNGEEVELIPAQVDLSLGDTIVIHNRDLRLHEVGPFSVQPGETLRYTFNRAGTYQGNCTVHPSGAVQIVVT